MQTKPITAVVTYSGIKKVKEILRSEKEKNPKLEISLLKYGQISDYTLITFDIDKSKYDSMIRILTNKKIRLILNKEDIKKLINQKEKTAKDKSKDEFEGWAGVKKKSKKLDKKTEELEKYILNGDYRSVINISRDISYGIRIMELAKKGIIKSINNAIDNAVKRAETHKYELSNIIDKLIEIASDKILKGVIEQSVVKNAALKAIKICEDHPAFLTKLLTISNNSALHNYANIQAAIVFSKISLKNPDKYEAELKLAVKELNTKWLTTAMDTVNEDFLLIELEHFERLVEYIDVQREMKHL